MARKTAHNDRVRENLTNLRRSLRKAVETKDSAKASETLKTMYSALDRAPRWCDPQACGRPTQEPVFRAGQSHRGLTRFKRPAERPGAFLLPKFPNARTRPCNSLLALFLCTVSLSADRQPNVIVIFTDDQGSVDLNCYGAKDLTTPHMDSLAKRGVRFTQFYAAAPVCSPSRAGLLTGRYPVRAGMPGNAGSTKGRPGLAPDEVTLAETLRAGYATAHIENGIWATRPKPCPTVRASITPSATWAAASTTTRISFTGKAPIATISGATAKRFLRTENISANDGRRSRRVY